MKNYILALLIFIPSLGNAQDLSVLERLERLTNAICTPIADINVGELSKTYFDSEADARLKGVLRGFADAGLEGAGGFETTTYINSLAKAALAGEINSQRECNERIYQDFRPQIQEWLSTSRKSKVNIEVHTANVNKAGTDSRLYFYLIDSKGNNIETIFTDGGAGDDDRILEQAMIDVFNGTVEIKTAPAFLRIKMEMEGSGRHWLGESIRVNAPDMGFSACANLRDTAGWLTSTNLQTKNIALGSCD